MSIDLESIQEMWEKDAKIDRDNPVSYTHQTLPTILRV